MGTTARRLHAPSAGDAGSFAIGGDVADGGKADCGADVGRVDGVAIDDGGPVGTGD